MLHTNYLDPVLNVEALTRTVNVAKNKLQGVEFDAFVVMGNSGTLFVGALAVAMQKGIILVRKNSDDRHSQMKIEGDDQHKRIIFLDDFIGTR